jgi:hypothetical protein
MGFWDFITFMFWFYLIGGSFMMYKAQRFAKKNPEQAGLAKKVGGQVAAHWITKLLK